MGGRTYSRATYSSTNITGKTRGSGIASKTAAKKMKATEIASKMDPKGRSIKTESKYPILIGLDVTGSNRELAQLTYDKAPMFHGQIEMHKYLPGMADMSFCAIGDAFTDDSPLQVADFAYGIEIDKWLEQLYLEGGGGGQQSESYELFAYYALNHIKMPNAEIPFCFIIADEQPYLNVDADHIKDIIGGSTQSSIPSIEVFTDLLEKFKGNLFILLNNYCGREDSPYTPKIRQSWIGVLPEENIIKISQEKGIIDVILGVVAMVAATRDLDGYKSDLKEKGQTASRIKAVSTDLRGLSESRAIIPVVEGDLPVTSDAKVSVGGAKTL
ncbi:hypothetical protein KAR91_38100 [Candidatus Pacearchaeota archaeon]|nr:hypothetical protein [Candidatus Pacearchaeota archaeon]